MPKEQKLPHSIIRKAVTIFAGENGMSCSQMTNFFKDYGHQITDYKDLNPKPSRKELFKGYLNSFPKNKQIRILKDFCGLEKSLFEKGAPSQEKIKDLKEELDEVVESIVQVDSIDRYLNSKYVQEQIEKGERKIKEGDYDGAITNSRSLIESVLKACLLEFQDEVDKYNGNMNKMFKDLSGYLDITATEVDTKGIKKIYSGCFSLIDGIAYIRNHYSDSHGRTEKIEEISVNEAKLCVNASRTFCEFIIDKTQEVKSNNYKLENKTA